MWLVYTWHRDWVSECMSDRVGEWVSECESDRISVSHCLTFIFQPSMHFLLPTLWCSFPHFYKLLSVSWPWQLPLHLLSGWSTLGHFIGSCVCEERERKISECECNVLTDFRHLRAQWYSTSPLTANLVAGLLTYCILHNVCVMGDTVGCWLTFLLGWMYLLRMVIQLTISLLHS